MRVVVSILLMLLPFFRLLGQQIHFCGVVVPTGRPAVKNRLEMAVKKNRKEIDHPQLQQKIGLYLPYFSIILRQYGLPDDLKYLPLAESRLQRNTSSPVGAAGVWQFMPKTATDMGLDPMDRNAVIKSTHAACRLLAQLYKELNDWPLAVAAYNFGAGNIRKAIQRQGHRDYFSLQLNAETADYIYQILSFKILLTDTGLDLPAVTAAAAMASPVPVPEGWQQSGFGHTLLFSSTAKSEHSEPVPLPDSFSIPAVVIKDSYIGKDQVLAFSTAINTIIPEGTVIKGLIYGRQQSRANIVVQGVDIGTYLLEYSGEVYGPDGLVGIPVSSTGRGIMGFSAGQKVNIKFSK